MAVSTPNPRERAGSVVLSPRSFDSTAMVKLKLSVLAGQTTIQGVFHLVKDLSIQREAFDIAIIKLNGRNLLLESPENQEKYFDLIQKYTNTSRYSWKLQADVVEITLNGYEEDPDWIALIKQGGGPRKLLTLAH
ncbi:MAG: hypothetical protein KDD22_04025 [Bdellovibrionales bacterium]|nr:hypothetical protein [Bdellovibrionales bacterium]